MLAELQHGVTLNATLFALFKKLTLLAAITLTRLNLSEQIREDGSIDAALRNVRLASDQRRGSLLMFLSKLDLTLPLDTLITAIEDQRPEFANNKTLTGQVDTLLRVLERLVEQRVKQQRGGGAHREHANQKLEFSPLTLAEDQVQISRISALLTHQGWRGLSDGELEIQCDRPTDQETWLITQQGDAPEAVPPLMDWQARAQQSQSVALSMSLRAQLLPCDPGCAQARDITTLVKALCKGAAHQPAMLALLAMLVLGLDWPALGQLPVWTRGPAKWPGPGRAFGKDEEHFNDNGIWCLETHFALQRWHQVANSQVHRGLNALLPKVHFYLLLPLPEQLRPLIVDDRWQPVTRQMLQQTLGELCQRYRLTLTLAQLSRYLTQWLKRHQVDEAISGLLRRKTAQQCAPLAYSHLQHEAVLRVWHSYLAQLGCATDATPAPDTAIGSRLYPDSATLRTLLAPYQHYLSQPEIVALRRQYDPRYHNLLVRHTLLILNLATGARPVTDMYGERRSYDPRLAVMLLTDKEARDCSAARLVPLPPLALAQLQALDHHLAQLAMSRVPGLQAAATAAQAARDNQRPMLFWLERDDSTDSTTPWQVAPITVQSMCDHFDTLLPLPANWHRHALRSELLARAVPTHLINALLGHEEMGQEFGHPFSGASLQSLRTLAPLIQTWLEALGLTALAGWGCR